MCTHPVKGWEVVYGSHLGWGMVFSAGQGPFVQYVTSLRLTFLYLDSPQCHPFLFWVEMAPCWRKTSKLKRHPSRQQPEQYAANLFLAIFGLCFQILKKM